LKKRFHVLLLLTVIILSSAIIFGVITPRKPRGTAFYISYSGFRSFDEMVDDSLIIARVRIQSVNSVVDTRMFPSTKFNAKIIKAYKNESRTGSTIVIGMPGIETETEIKDASLNPLFGLGEEAILFLGHQDTAGSYWFQGVMGRSEVRPGRVKPGYLGYPVVDQFGTPIEYSEWMGIQKYEALIRYYVEN
jgi:hypothetical protein